MSDLGRFSNFSEVIDETIPRYILWYMQTTVMFKTDKKLKEAAQETARRMGIPFSAALNRLMQDFVAKQEITFSAEQYNPTPYLRRILDQGEKDLKEGKNIKTFNSVEEAFAEWL